jgi:hypothetical protein
MVITFTTDLGGYITKPKTLDVRGFEVTASRHEEYKYVYFAVIAYGYSVGDTFRQSELVDTAKTFEGAEKIIADFKEKYGWRDD